MIASHSVLPALVVFILTLIALSLPRGAVKRRVLLHGWGGLLVENMMLSAFVALVVYFGITLG